MSTIRYRNCTISRNLKPIPIRNYDWDWVHDDYDGPEGPNLCGCEASVEACIRAIDEMLGNRKGQQ